MTNTNYIGRRLSASFGACLGLVLASAAAVPAWSVPVSSAAWISAAAGVLVEPLDAGKGYKLEAGPYEPMSLPLVLHDASRNKDLQVMVRYPKAKAGGELPTTLPMVVFSHGMGGSRDAFGDLTAHWASHGYIVVLPTHDDSVKLQREQGKDVRNFFTKANTKNVDLIQRVNDVKFILDSIPTIETKVKEIGAGRVDRERLAIAGHSAGALTTQLAYGMKARTRANPLEAVSIADPRFKAAVVVSGQGVKRGWIKEDAWNDVKGPMFVITGSEDVASVSDETPATRRHPYEYAPAGDKYLLFIQGATHSSYQGTTRLAVLGDKDPANVRDIQSMVAAGTTAFLDAYLKKDDGGLAYLKEDRLKAYCGTNAEVLRK
jgi:predicted dienelactone hydrolase